MSAVRPTHSTPSHSADVATEARLRDDTSLEHVQDVFRVALDHLTAGEPGAIAVITGTSGGAVRAPGAVMFVSAQGTRHGYLSGGCIDADVALEAVRAIETGTPVQKAYGEGSGVLDLPLPCGGRIDVTITPLSDRTVIDRCLAELDARRPARYPADFVRGAVGPFFTAVPKLRIRMAGKGADLTALAKLAVAAGHELRVQTPDQVTSDDLSAAGIAHERLTSARSVSAPGDDAFTAFVLMFHDPDWETPLLLQALRGPAFYIGAVGSAAAQVRRLGALQRAGADDAARVRGPIGLVPSTRNASDLAISALAEIIREFAKATAAATVSASEVAA